MSNEELIKDYLKQIKHLEFERWMLMRYCSEMSDKIDIYDDYEPDIKAYKEEINKLTK